MAAEGAVLVARDKSGSERHNTIRFPKIDVVVDDPILGTVPELVVDVAYADGTRESHETDDTGTIRVSSARGAWVDLEAEISTGPYRIRCFVLLAPLDSDEGAWQRLVNLGYVDDEAPSPQPPDSMELEAAIEEFQADRDLNPTGELDDETRAALAEDDDPSMLWAEREVSEGDDDDDDDFGDEPKGAQT